MCLRWSNTEICGWKLVYMRATVGCEYMSSLMHFRIIVHFWNKKQTAAVD